MSVHLGTLLSGCEGRVQRQHGLDADAEPRDVEGFKHDLRGHLAVLWWIQGRLCQDEIVVITIHS